MSRLLIVRHGQASAGEDDYDQLSALGWRQAEVLGRHWGTSSLALDEVWVGPCRRHRETAEGVMRGLAECGVEWPAHSVDEGLDEHAGFEVFARSLPVLAPSDPEARTALERLRGDLTHDRDLFYRVYRRVTLDWVRGELELPGPPVESFAQFRRRTDEALDRLLREPGSGRRVVVFTSAGPTGVAVARAMGLGDEKALELSWIVRNSAVTEFVFGPRSLKLLSFNGLPHLRRRELETWV